MKQRFDVNADTSRLKDNGYPWTVKIGSGFQNDDGTIDVSLDALPIVTLDKNGKARVRLKLWPAKDGGNGGFAPQSGGSAPAAAGFDDDDASVPF